MLDTTTRNMSPTVAKKQRCGSDLVLIDIPDATTKKQRKGVSFSRTSDVYNIPALSSMTEKEIHDTWYSRTEFKVLKMGTAQILKKIMLGLHPLEGPESEARGLGSMTPKGRKSQRANTHQARRAVLDEQDRQFLAYGRTLDVETLSALYSQRTQHCQRKARYLATKDARFVHGDDASMKDIVGQATDNCARRRRAVYVQPMCH